MSTHTSSDTIKAKKAAALAAAQLIQNNMTVGLGTGSTAAFFLDALIERCQKERLKIKGLPTSKQTMEQALKGGIPLLNDQSVQSLDLTVDGADEIDPNKNMIKGGGGALLREKLIAKSSREMIVIVDENKLVKGLGAFPVPVEIVSFAYQTTLRRLQEAGYKGTLRLNRDKTIYITDNGNYIFDIQYPTPITDPQKEDERLRTLTGVVETGLFYGIAGRVIVGYQDGVAKIL